MEAKVKGKTFTAPELAELLRCNRARFHKLLRDGRIIGAEQLSTGLWIIPDDFDIVDKPEGAGGPPLMVAERMMDLREQGILRAPTKTRRRR